MYPPKIEGDSEVVTAFVPLAEPLVLDACSIANGVVNIMLPRTTCAVLTHCGSYQSIGDTYRQLGAWVATNATVVDQPVREVYIVNTDEAGDLLPDSELRTEIASDHPLFVANWVVKSFRQPFMIDGRPLAVRLSIGVAWTTADSTEVSAESLLRQADLAMYTVKREGGGSAYLFRPEIQLADTGEPKLRHDPIRAVTAKEVGLVHQPTGVRANRSHTRI